MIEAATNSATRRAYDAAREERARAIRSAWAWLFGSR